MKQDRVLELFFRGLRGEDISVKNLAAEYRTWHILPNMAILTASSRRSLVIVFGAISAA